MGKTSKCGTKNISFASSEKARRFECAKLKGKTVEDVGGIDGVLGGRLRKSGTKSAKDLTCLMQGMTKRKYLRFIMKVRLLSFMYYYIGLDMPYRGPIVWPQIV